MSVTTKNKLFIIPGAIMLTASIFISTVFAEDVLQAYRVVDENGYSQIAYIKSNIQKIITKDNFSHADPVTNGKEIAWASQIGSLWQIFYYDVQADYTIQLTGSGNNVNPQMTDNLLVWEGQRNGVWQVLMFDGLKVKQISNGPGPIQNIAIEDSLIAYSQKDLNTEKWHIYIYDAAEKKFVSIDKELTGKKPTIKDKIIIWEDANPENGEKNYYTYDASSKKTYFEEANKKRQRFFNKLEKQIQALASKQNEPNEVIKPYKPGIKIDRPVDTEWLSMEDVQNELNVSAEDVVSPSTKENIDIDSIIESSESIQSTEAKN